MKLIELILNFFKIWYIWVGILIAVCVFFGWLSISEVKIFGKQVIDKIEKVDIDLNL